MIHCLAVELQQLSDISLTAPSICLTCTWPSAMLIGLIWNSRVQQFNGNMWMNCSFSTDWAEEWKVHWNVLASFLVSLSKMKAWRTFRYYWCNVWLDLEKSRCECGSLAWPLPHLTFGFGAGVKSAILLFCVLLVLTNRASYIDCGLITMRFSLCCLKWLMSE